MADIDNIDTKNNWPILIQMSRF